MIPFLDLKTINHSYEPGLSAAIAGVLDSGLFVRGEQVKAFERSYADFIGTRYCVGVGNGFDALRLILRAWMLAGKMRERDEVIVPSNTYIASILAISENRLQPVLVEPDPRTCTVPAEAIRSRLTTRTRAIMVVHLYGRNAADEGLMELARDHGLMVLEDNAQATGCMWKGRRTGSLGNAAAHSFFPTKNLGALGDGGAVTTDDPNLAETVRTLGNYGSPAKGVNTHQGVNSRLDELQAAVLMVKLRGLDRDNEVRRTLARKYFGLISHPDIALPTPPEQDEEHVWHLYVVRCTQRDALQSHLEARGIQTLVHYPIPPHKQEAFKEWHERSFPIAEQLHREVLSLPLSPALDEDAVGRISAAVNDFRR